MIFNDDKSSPLHLFGENNVISTTLTNTWDDLPWSSKWYLLMSSVSNISHKALHNIPIVMSTAMVKTFALIATYTSTIQTLLTKNILNNLYGYLYIKYHYKFFDNSNILLRINGKDFSGKVSRVGLLSTKLHPSNVTMGNGTLSTTIIPNAHFIENVITFNRPTHKHKAVEV
jgi:hypothetical protein